MPPSINITFLLAVTKSKPRSKEAGQSLEPRADTELSPFGATYMKLQLTDDPLGGNDVVALATVAHPFASVTVTVRETLFPSEETEIPNPPALDHEYVYGPVPPDGAAVRVALT